VLPSLKTGKYYALIIGIDNYRGEWPKLNNAVRDAKAVEDFLRTSYSFDKIITLYDNEATRTEIFDTFEWLVENVIEDDNVLIYFSGHGELKKNLKKGFWVPVDATTQSVVDLISNSDIHTFIGGIDSKHTLLISDACFAGDIFRSRRDRIPFEDSERYYSEVYRKRSRQAITSGGVEPVMDGGRDGHSVFTYYFLKALKDNESKYFDAGMIYDELKVPVSNNSKQTPMFQSIKNTGDEGGQFVFIRSEY